ncbi:hypothetical protein VaNZ11_006721, partial [Volvox africanus]
DELTATEVNGGCSIGWRNSGYNDGTTVPVGLRVMDVTTGQFNDLTFLVMVVRSNFLPVVGKITFGGMTLPQNGGSVTMYVGKQSQVCISWGAYIIPVCSFHYTAYHDEGRC